MTKKTQKRDLQIMFIHQFKRATRTPWPDKFRLCWYFNPETLDYVYEHKNEQFVTNGFVIEEIFRAIGEVLIVLIIRASNRWFYQFR